MLFNLLSSEHKNTLGLICQACDNSELRSCSLELYNLLQTPTKMKKFSTKQLKRKARPLIHVIDMF